MKKTGYLILISCLLISCSDKVDFSNPKSIVTQYYSLKYDGKLELQYELLADTCKEYATKEDFMEYYANTDSLPIKYEYSVLKIDQLPIDPINPKYRRFEVQYIKTKNEGKDTIKGFTYSTIFNEKGKWKVIWSDNILKAANILMESQKFLDAIQAYKELLKYDPLNGTSFRKIGWCQFRQNYDKEALRSVQKAVELNPKDASNYNLIAGIYSGQNNNELAAENFKRAIDMTQNSYEKPTLLSNLCICYMILSEYSKAQMAVSEAISIDSLHTHAWWQKGKLFVKESKSDSAIICFKKAISLKSMGDFLQKELYFDLAKSEYKEIANDNYENNERDTLLLDAKAYTLKAMDLQPDNSEYKKLLNQINSLK